MATPKRKPAPKSRAPKRPARELARIALPGGGHIPVTAEPLTPAQIDAVIRASRPTYLRGELALYRRDLLRDGHAPRGAAAHAADRRFRPDFARARKARADLARKGAQNMSRNENEVKTGVGYELKGGFTYELRQAVKLAESGEMGTVVGRAEYTNSRNGYFIRYRAADGRQVEQWWPEDSLLPA